jgi:hypothetical protein
MNEIPAAVGAMPRPRRSNNFTPTSRSKADTAPETDGCVTTNSDAAPLSDPVLATARNVLNCVTVIVISLILTSEK